MRRRGSMVRWLVLAALLGTPALGSWAWWSRGRPPIDSLAAGYAAYDRGDWEAAQELARRRLKSSRDDLAAQRLLARTAIRLGRDESAAAIYQRLGATRLEAEDLCVLGQSLRRSGKPSPAMELWQEARGRDPRHAEALFELAR